MANRCQPPVHMSYVHFDEFYFVLPTYLEAALNALNSLPILADKSKLSQPQRKCIWLCFDYVIEFLMLIWEKVFVFHSSKQT